MKKIITAVDNPKLNEQLKQEEYIEVIAKDISYKEGILETLKKEINIDIIIIKDNLPGEIGLENLIKKIKEINKEIKIIYLVEDHSTEKIETLKKYDITKIYNKNLEINEFIEILKDDEINEKEEIKKEIENLKKIILEKDLNQKLKSKKIHRKKIIDILKRKKDNLKDEREETKIISILGGNKSGKMTIVFNICFLLKDKNKKILIINLNQEKEKLMKKVIDENRKVKIKKFIKSKIKKFKIQKNNLIISINSRIDFTSKPIFISEQKKQKLIENYNYIFCILTNLKNKREEDLIKKSFRNILILEPNFLGIKEAQNLVQTYKKNSKIQKNVLNIIINKKNKYSIHEEILKNIFNETYFIGDLKQNNYYEKQMNLFFQNLILIQNKKIKNEYEKILNKIIEE